MTKAYEQDIKRISDAITSIKVTFQRPNVYFNVHMDNEPSAEVVQAVLSRTKAFATVENISAIAEAVNWGIEISEVHLSIRLNNADVPAYHYMTSYFKTSDASNYSAENIDAYSTWHEFDHSS